MNKVPYFEGGSRLEEGGSKLEEGGSRLAMIYCHPNLGGSEGGSGFFLLISACFLLLLPLPPFSSSMIRIKINSIYSRYGYTAGAPGYALVLFIVGGWRLAVGGFLEAHL